MPDFACLWLNKLSGFLIWVPKLTTSAAFRVHLKSNLTFYEIEKGGLGVCPCTDKIRHATLLEFPHVSRACKVWQVWNSQTAAIVSEFGTPWRQYPVFHPHLVAAHVLMSDWRICQISATKSSWAWYLFLLPLVLMYALIYRAQTPHYWYSMYRWLPRLRNNERLLHHLYQDIWDWSCDVHGCRFPGAPEEHAQGVASFKYLHIWHFQQSVHAQIQVGMSK